MQLCWHGWRKRVNAFPWLNGEWGGKAGDRRLQTALWLDAVAVKMCLKADDDPQSGCQVLHVTCPPSLTTILWMEVAITKAKSRRPNLLGLSTCLSLKTSLSSLGGGWKWFLVALCWSRRVTRVTCSPGSALSAATLCMKRSISHFGRRCEK